MRHHNGTNGDFPGSFRVQEFIRILIRNICSGMMLNVCFAERDFRNCGGNQCNSTPPTIRRFCVSKMPMYTFMGHGTSYKMKITSNQNVERKQQSARRMPEVCCYGANHSNANCNSAN